MKSSLIKLRSKRGFTLVELLISMPLALLIMGSVLTTFLQCKRIMQSQRIRSNLDANLRTTMNYLIHDLAMANYGLTGVSSNELPQWINWTTTALTQNPQITPGYGSTSDKISVAAAYERIGMLDAAATSGATVVYVPTNLVSKFDTGSRSVVFIGRCELARIISMYGNQLTISTDPVSSKGLLYDHGTNSPIEMVKVYTYEVQNFYGDYDSNYYVRRIDEADSTSDWWRHLLATDICDIQISQSGERITVTLGAQSKEVDFIYGQKHTNDVNRKQYMTSEIFMRNNS